MPRLTDDRSSDVVSEAERATARRLIDEINEVNVEATASETSASC